ncbi:hypothetical protein AJ79_06232 [Helicocarpus griseus UAMH5409]|uniref:Uncharacterized protein n=1 Tax=Helicocarpus griseus UAMH5409 TaxID=1447875 RepID=A0A2B7XFR7_9EURO|nr:hypothetical protein AJ79_06232 [Helicocarpus griseus UAMH5409]
MDFESQLAALQTELQNMETSSSVSRPNRDPASWLPGSQPRHFLEGHRETINSVAFHPLFSSIASCSDDCTIKIWDWELGELEITIKGHTKAVLDVNFGGPRCSILLASCSSDLTVKLWDLMNGYRNVRTLQGHDHSVNAVRFIPFEASGTSLSKSLLVSASRDHTLKIWDVSTRYCMRTIQGHTDWVQDVCPSPDGKSLISTAASYKHLASLAKLQKPPPASSTVEFMATGSRDKIIKLWDARGTCIKTLIGHDNWTTKRFGAGTLAKKGNASRHPKTCIKASSLASGELREQPKMGLCVPVRLPKAQMPITHTHIRCVIATGCVDQKLRIFAN